MLLFGYVKPFKADLKMSEFEIYKAVYCNLCKCLGQDFGITSRLLLSYDCTFLAMISIIASEESKIKISRGKCVCNFLKKCNYVEGNESSFYFAAAVGVIMSYYKIYDNIADSFGINKMKFYPIQLLFFRAYKKAAREFPEIDKIVKNFIVQQQNVEKKSINASIDESAHPTATALSQIFSLVLPELKDFGYFLGRWVYIIDAADDLTKDIKNKNFNPLKNLCDDKVQINEILNQTVFQVISSYNLYDKVGFSPIINNVIKLGLANVQKNILFRKDDIK